MIKLKDLVLIHDDCALRHLWRTGVVTELYYSNSDNQIRGLDWSGETINRPINKLYPLKIIEEKERKGNELKNMSRRQHREVAIMGEVKKKIWTLLSRGGGVFVIASGFVIKKYFHWWHLLYCTFLLLTSKDISIGRSRLTWFFLHVFCLLFFYCKAFKQLKNKHRNINTVVSFSCPTVVKFYSCLLGININNGDQNLVGTVNYFVP